MMVHVQERIDDPEKNLRELRELERKFYGSPIIRKADADVAPATPAYTTAPDWVQPLFGRKVWSFLNYEKNVFAILPKEVWKQSGWRLLTAAGQSWAHSGAELAGGIARGGALPDTIAPTIVVNATQPKEVIHTWGTEEIYEFMSSIDDSVEIIPLMREELGKEHAAIINTMLVQSVEYLAGNSSGNWAGTDNFETLDRIIASDAEEDAVGGSHDHYYDPWKKYGILDIDRDSGTTYDAVVKAPGGTLGTDGDLTLWAIEEVWRTIIEAGGKPDVILTGADFVTALSEILEPERRFIGEAKVMPQYGGVRGIAAGVEAGFSVATFRGIPIITTAAMRCTDSSYGDTISKAMFLDTEYLSFKVAAPTRYMETKRDYTSYVAQDKLRIEGAYLTVGELICYRFNVQGKLRDIK